MLDMRWTNSAVRDVEIFSTSSAIEELFTRLAQLPPGGPEFLRLRDAIIELSLPIAEHIALRFRNRGESCDDLIQVARMGLFNAVVRYDVEKKSGFISFAVPTITGEVRRHFRDNTWSLKVPRRVKELYPRISGATRKLTQQHGRAPTASELAAELHADRDEIVEALIALSSRRTLSTDLEVCRSSRASAEAMGKIDSRLSEIEDREMLRPLLAALPDLELTVLGMRFFESLSQSQIAERIGISQPQVSRLLAKSLAHLRTQLLAPFAGCSSEAQ